MSVYNKLKYQENMKAYKERSKKQHKTRKRSKYWELTAWNTELKRNIFIWEELIKDEIENCIAMDEGKIYLIFHESKSQTYFGRSAGGDPEVKPLYKKELEKIIFKHKTIVEEKDEEEKPLLKNEQ